MLIIQFYEKYNISKSGYSLKIICKTIYSITSQVIKSLPDYEIL